MEKEIETHAGAPGCKPAHSSADTRIIGVRNQSRHHTGEEEPPTYSLAAYEKNPLKPTGHHRPASRLSVLIRYLEANLIGCVLGFISGVFFAINEEIDELCTRRIVV